MILLGDVAFFMTSLFQGSFQKSFSYLVGMLENGKFIGRATQDCKHQ